MKEYDFVIRTFYTYDGKEIKWYQSYIDEKYSNLNWFDRWVMYAENKDINLEMVKHNHKIEYIKWEVEND